MRADSMQLSKLSHGSLAMLLVLGGLFAACARFDAPPEVSIGGAKDGKLADVSAPLDLLFSKPIKPETLAIKIVALETDREGNLADEDEDEDTTLRPLVVHDSDVGDRGGVAELLDGNTRLRITPTARFPVGTTLAILVEPGLSDEAGDTTRVRRRLTFGYEFECTSTVGTKLFPSGTYFMLLDVEQPIGVQIQILGAITVDPATGAFRGQFTNADRNPNPARCPTPCASTEACQLVPAPACVAPSLRASEVDEYVDFVPNPTPPTGYTFVVSGCVQDQDEQSVAFASAPANVVVQSPAVSVNGLVVTASFRKDAAGVLRGTGAIAGDDIVFGAASLGSGQGTMKARLVPVGEVPPGVPPAPPLETPDAGSP